MFDYQLFIKKALKAGFSEIEIVESGRSGLELAVFNGKVENNTTSKLDTISIRAIYNTKMAYFNIEDLDLDEDMILEKLKENALSINSEDEVEIFAGSEKYPTLKKVEKDFDKHSLKEKIDLLLDVEKKIKAVDKRIVVVPEVAYEESGNYTKIINSKGLDIKKSVDFCILIAEAVAAENGETQVGFEVELKPRFADLDVDKVINKTAKDALDMLGAKSLPSKSYPVIIENQAMGSLFNAFCGCFSGDNAMEKITPLLNKENEMIMSNLVDIIDAPLKEGEVNSCEFDDEGVACYDKHVVKNGKFIGMLHNLSTAKYFKTTSTGNGFKGRGGLGVSGCNLHIEASNDAKSMSKEEMIETIEEGVLLTGFDGLHAGVDPIGGDFSLKTSGYFIEKGKITRPVTLIVVSGNFYKIMNDVEIVGNDLKIGFMGVGAPSIKFKAMPISGN